MTNEVKMSVIDALMGRLVEIRRSLETAVLDGTPYLLIAVRDGRELFYCGDRKFRALETLDWHCCGAMLMSPESADASIASLEAKGIAARKLHRREHAQSILKEVETHITNLTNAL